MRTKNRIFVGDFETTVYEGQEDTQVWASGLCEIGTEDAKIFHSIGDTFDYICSLQENCIIYYHNLAFDGSFWLSYLMVEAEYKQAVGQCDKLQNVWFLDNDDMKNKTFKYNINEMGLWYSVTIKVNNKLIQLRDSLKLLPFPLKKIGESFGTKHKKLDMEYTGFRYAGCEITEEEEKYLKNDLFVIKEALEIMFKEGHNKLTIGSCCLAEYKSIWGKNNFETLFPNIYLQEIDMYDYCVKNAGEYIRRSYKGGWCYCVPEKTNRIYHDGITLDVNSLYPSMMHSESGNYYPVGSPTFWKGDIPEICKLDSIYYFVRIKCRFKLKENMLPTIQIKGNPLYPPNKWLETSDIYNRKTGKYDPYYINLDGRLDLAEVVLTMTQTDYKLFHDHYYVIDEEVLDGCYFHAQKGIFDEYIDKYKKIKLENKGAKRELAKLFLNNLYGKMGASTNSSFKYAYIKDDDSLGFVTILRYDKTPGYIPIGSAITSYARNFTIRTAQANYYGKNESGFIYADTDSIHCDIPLTSIKNVRIDDKNFCCWKLESQWQTALFCRQKTYIEIENNNYTIKCAGMTQKCKDLFEASIIGKENSKYNDEKEYNKLSDKDKLFIEDKRTIEDFKIGLLIPGKLMQKHIRGGTLLVDTTFEIR